jgi:hypothetical protein
MMFSVNRFGSTYWFSPETQAIAGTYTNKAQTLVVHEVNVSGIIMPKSSVTLSVNTGSLVLAEGTGFDLASSTYNNTSWHEYTYTLPASVMSEDGHYSLSVRSTDLAGHLSENAMPNKTLDRSSSAELSFVYDTTAPQGEITGVDESGSYTTFNQPIKASVRDNISWKTAVLSVDGKDVAWLDNTDNAPSGSLSYDILPTEQPVDIVLTITDRAGNIATVICNNITIIAPVLGIGSIDIPLVSVLGLSALQSGLLIGAGVLLLALIILFVVLFWRHKKKKEQGQIVFTGNAVGAGSSGLEPPTTDLGSGNIDAPTGSLASYT